MPANACGGRSAKTYGVTIPQQEKLAKRRMAQRASAAESRKRAKEHLKHLEDSVKQIGALRDEVARLNGLVNILKDALCEQDELLYYMTHDNDNWQRRINYPMATLLSSTAETKEGE